MRQAVPIVLCLLAGLVLLTCREPGEKPKNPYPGPEPWRVPPENVDPSCYRSSRGGGGGEGAQPNPSPLWRPVECEVDDDWDVEALALGDLDGDGFADLVLTTTWLYYYPDVYWYAGYSYYGIYYPPRSSTRVLVGDGQGKFRPPQPKALPNPSAAKGRDIWQGDSLALGDLDEDGDLDIVVACRDPAVSDYYLYSYSCRWGGIKYTYWYQYWYPTYGKLPDVRCLRNDGGGSFEAWSRKFIGSFGDPLSALGDVDGDGDLDMMTYGSDGFRLWMKEE